MKLPVVAISLLAIATLAVIVPWRGSDDGGRSILMTVWGMPFEDRLFRDGYADDFEAAHPEITVRYEKYATVTEKYLAWHVLGRGADVMRLPITDYHLLVERGALRPIDDLLDDPELGLDDASRADFMPALWNALEIDGARYAVPSDNAQLGLYWNRSIFDAFNAQHPDDPVPYPSPAWTWDDLRVAAEKLTILGADGRVEQFGFDVELWAWPYLTLFAQAGGELWTGDERVTGIASAQGVEALSFLIELVPHAATMRAADLTDTATGPDKLFAAGRTAMFMDGSWRAPFLELLAPELDFAIAPLPRHRRNAIVSGSVLWAISAHSDEPDMAWRLIRAMTDAPGALRYWDALRVAPPARMSVIRSEAFRATAGLVDEAGVVLTPAMPRDRWEDRGAWLLAAITPDENGRLPGFVPAGRHQRDLENVINALLTRAASRDDDTTLQTLLEDAAAELRAMLAR